MTDRLSDERLGELGQKADYFDVELEVATEVGYGIHRGLAIAYMNNVLPHDVQALVAEVREHRAERAAQLSGQIVAASLEDGVTALAASCSDDECECPEHDVAAPPRGTYATVRLHDEDQGVGLWRVRLVREGVSPDDHE